MRKYIIVGMAIVVGSCLFSCVDKQKPTSVNFLEDLRTVYFDQLNFNDETIISELPMYLGDFKTTYDLLEESYEAGEYIFEADLENMNLANFYYSSLLTAVTKAYLDGFISFEDIMGDRKTGLFSGKSKENSALERLELNALALRSIKVAELGMVINGENDRSKGAYLAARHVYARLRNPDNTNAEIEQQEMIAYAAEEIQDFTFLPVWNLMMSLVYFDNYEDASNTFENPEMEIVLDNVIERMQPEDLPTTDDNFTSVLVGIYQLDIVMKKIDWMIHRKEELSKRDIRDIKLYILRLNITEETIIEDGLETLTKWDFLSSFGARQDKVDEIETYISELDAGNVLPKPKIAPFFKSKNFRQAYQCYSCHKSPN